MQTAINEMQTALKTAIVGYGSIGKRHANVFKECGSEVSLVTSQTNVSDYKTYSNLQSCIKSEIPDVVVIANRTSDHHPTLKQLQELKFGGVVLIEKPLFESPYETKNFSFAQTLIAYNLRFHPGLTKLKSELKNQRVLSVIAYVGQNLQSWKPGSDYRSSYSAKKELGGGALRDLSHELDYISWMFGKPKNVTAIGGHISDLQIQSDDSWSILMTTENAAQVSVTLNYLDFAGERKLLVNTSEKSYRLNFWTSELHIKDQQNEKFEKFEVDSNTTYRAQAKAILNCDYSQFCNLSEGLSVVKLIEKIEQSNHQKTWVHL